MRVGVDKAGSIPLPFIPSHGGEGSFYCGFLKNVRDKLSDFMCKNERKSDIALNDDQAFNTMLKE
jgi:hypothetical protein